MCACVFFGTLQHIFVPYYQFGKLFCAFLALWVALGLHCNTWGLQFCMIFVLGGTLGLSLFVFGLHLGALGLFLRLLGRTLDPFFDFPRKGSKKVEKGEKKAAEIDAFS